MNRLLIVTLLIISTPIFAQSFNIGVYQDARLLCTKDILGNDPPQLDALIIGNLEWKYTNIDINYEYAKLTDPFHRITIGFGLHYKWKMLKIGHSFNGGYIIRPFSTTFSLGSHSYLAYVYKRFELIALIQVTQRTEWKDMIRWSGFMGLNYKIL